MPPFVQFIMYCTVTITYMKCLSVPLPCQFWSDLPSQDTNLEGCTGQCTSTTNSTPADPRKRIVGPDLGGKPAGGGRQCGVTFLSIIYFYHPFFGSKWEFNTKYVFQKSTYIVICM